MKVSWLVGQSVGRRSVSWLRVGRSVGGLVGWLVSQLFGQSIGRSVGRGSVSWSNIGWSVGQLVGRSVIRSVDRSVGHSVS